MTVKLRRYEPSVKPDNDLPKLLMVEWRLDVLIHGGPLS
jgi:hypothetical protein